MPTANTGVISENEPEAAAPQNGLDVVRSVLAYGRQQHGFGPDTNKPRGFTPNGSPDYDNDGDAQSTGLAETRGYAEGGVVDTDEDQPAEPDADADDVTGSIPTGGSAIPLPRKRPAGLPIGAAFNQNPTGSMQERFPVPEGGEFDSQNVPAGEGAFNGQAGSVKKILAYLMGSAAAHPQEVAEREAQQPDEDPNDKKVATIAAAAQESPQKGFSVLQAFRRKYDHAKGFAAAAADNGDLASAAQAANLAFTNLPDGRKYQFFPSQGQMVAQVTDPQGKTQIYQFSGQEFGKYLQSPSAMFDALVDGAPLREGGQPPVQPNLPGMRDPSERPITEGDTAKHFGVDEETVRAVDQQTTDPRKRAALFMQQRQKSEENVIAHEKAKTPTIVQQMRGETANQVAGTRSATAKDVAGIHSASARETTGMKTESSEKIAGENNKTKLQIQQEKGETWLKQTELKGKNALMTELARRENIMRDTKTREAMATLRTLLNTGAARNLKQAVDMAEAQGINVKGAMASVGQQVGIQPQTSVSTKTTVPSPSGDKKLVNGKWYTRGPNGEAIEAQGP